MKLETNQVLFPDNINPHRDRSFSVAIELDPEQPCQKSCTLESPVSTPLDDAKYAISREPSVARVVLHRYDIFRPTSYSSVHSQILKFGLQALTLGLGSATHHLKQAPSEGLVLYTDFEPAEDEDTHAGYVFVGFLFTV